MAIQKTKAIKPYLFESDFNIIDKKVISGLLNVLISPVFNSKEEINVIYRFLDKDISNDYSKNYLPRLKFSNTKSFNLVDEDLKSLEFILIATKQYSACLIYDFSLLEIKNQAIFCSYVNSKKIEEILKILLPEERFPQERRTNIELNSAFLNLIKLSENSQKELNINEEDKKKLENITQNLKRDEIVAKRARFISHEIKNQLSIIDVYTKIIENSANNPNIAKNATIIYKSIKSVNNLLKDLKTFSEAELNIYNLSEVIEEAVNSVKELATTKNISLSTELKTDCMVVLDKNKFQNVLINLIKNAIEALNDTDKKDKYIELSTKETNGYISLTIMNNGPKIEKEVQSKIFNEGFTTKEEGSGLGLFICKQNLKEQFCDLSLLKSTSAMTVFEIKINKI